MQPNIKEMISLTPLDQFDQSRMFHQSTSLHIETLNEVGCFMKGRKFL